VIGQRYSADASPDSPAQMQETFGRYRLLGLLGQGGMGRLYIAERRGVQGFVKIVALKRILPHLADSARLRDMFLNEARIAARLEHPNIVATYELGEVEGKYFISMEYLPGEDLSAVAGRCQGGQAIPIEIAALLAQQAAQGLQYAHDARDGQGRLIGLVHRDVSPRNIFVTYHGVVKLLDFGMVRNPAGPKSVPGVFKGKYGYCAPEQLESGRIDRRTDVFCLGIVLWECLTGARLFDGATDPETIGAVRSRPVDPPSLLRPEVPAALDQIALRALARDPSQRYQSAAEMSEDLDRFLLSRNNRPTTKTVGQWIESLFGAERAALKKSISQGDNAEGALQRLNALESVRPPARGIERSSSRAVSQPRALWSTSFEGPLPEASVPEQLPNDELASTRPVSVSPEGAPLEDRPAPPPAIAPLSPPLPLPLPGQQAPRARSKAPVIVAALVVLGGLAGAGVFVMRGQGQGGASSSASANQSTATLEIHSRPEGASIFVDGRPTGLKTPATISGLPVGRTLNLRIAGEGFRPISRETTPTSGPPETLSFTLEPASARSDK
jgi:serine/threonine protein kinase